jgi:PTH1 family peptidyl-tRNA hydrolase
MAKIQSVGEGVLVVQPTTFMNLSGMAVAHFRSYYGIELPEMLVVVDDADLPLGRLRIRASGSAGGHKGLKSIIDQLGSNEFPRLRIGVGRDTSRDLADHVLSRFALAERGTMDRAVKRAVDAADLFVADGIAKVMNTFNSEERESQPGPEPEA